jgi:hypothetical protein
MLVNIYLVWVMACLSTLGAFATIVFVYNVWWGYNVCKQEIEDIVQEL